MTAEAQERFAGHENRECGEHRTLGRRAWCYACSTYCYPSGPCPGCELPQLRAENRALVEALQEIADTNGWEFANVLADKARAALDQSGKPEHLPECEARDGADPAWDCVEGCPVADQSGKP